MWPVCKFIVSHSVNIRMHENIEEYDPIIRFFIALPSLLKTRNSK